MGVDRPSQERTGREAGANLPQPNVFANLVVRLNLHTGSCFGIVHTATKTLPV